MKKLLVLTVVLGLVAVVLVVIDRVAVAAASENLRQSAQERTRGAGSASARIRSFPFLGRLLLRGTMERVEVGANDVGAGPLRFTSIRAALDDVTIDRSRLLENRQVRLTGLRQGTVTAELTDDEISKVLPAKVQFLGGGRASVSIAGVTAQAMVTVRGGTLTLAAARLRTLSLPIPRAPLLYCAVQEVEVLEGRIRASCTIDRLPEELARATVLGL